MKRKQKELDILSKMFNVDPADVRDEPTTQNHRAAKRRQCQRSMKQPPSAHVCATY